MIKVIHNKCGKIAFYFKRRYIEGELLIASDVVYLDGSEAKSFDKIVCGNCGEPIQLTPYIVSQVDEDWRDWFIQDNIKEL